MHSLSNTNYRLAKAIKLASDLHKHQRRKGDNTPYFFHLIEVMSLLLEHGYSDTDLLVSSLLHDALEDTNLTYEQLHNEFGNKVANTVKSLTDDKEFSLEERYQARLDKLECADENHRLIKLVDGISNARLIPTNWSLEKAQRSLSQLQKIADMCRDSNEILCDLLQDTIAESLQKHSNFVNDIKPQIAASIGNQNVYYCFEVDSFVYVKSIEENGNAEGIFIKGKGDIFLRTLRRDSLELYTENRLKVVVKEVGLINITEAVFEPICKTISEPNGEPRNEPVNEKKGSEVIFNCVLVNYKKSIKM